MEKKILIILLILLVQNGVCQDANYMSKSWNYTVKEFLSGIDVGDIDGDGKLNVLATGSSDSFLYNLDEDGQLKWMYSGGGYVHTLKTREDSIVTAYGRNIYLINSEAERIAEYHSGSDMLGASIRKIINSNIDDDSETEAIFTIYNPQTCQRKKEVIAVDLTPKVDDLWSYISPGNRFAFTLDSFDLNGDGKQEIVVGEINRGLSKGSCTPLFQLKSSVVVLNPDNGGVLWKHDTEGGVVSVLAQDLDGDGTGEVIAGDSTHIYVLNHDGNLKCTHDVLTRVDVIKSADLDGDGVQEILFGADNLYAIDNECKKLWVGETASRVYSMDVGDLDGDTKPEIAAGSESIYIFSPNGKQLYKSEAYLTVGFLKMGDTNNNGYLEVVSGALKTINVYQSRAYETMLEADRYLEKAYEKVQEGDLEGAEENAKNALKLYNKLAVDEKSKETLDLMEAMRGHVEIDDDAILAKADAYYKQAKKLEEEGDFINSTRLAMRARYDYSSISYQPGIFESKRLLNKTLPLVIENASKELEEAEILYIENLTEKAYKHAKYAEETFIIAQDSQGANKARELLKKIAPEENQQTNKNSISSIPEGVNKNIIYFIIGVSVFVICLGVVYHISRKFLSRKRLRISDIQNHQKQMEFQRPEPEKERVVKITTRRHGRKINNPIKK